jgi:DNA-binding Lrp family transcriptional regulator
VVTATTALFRTDVQRDILHELVRVPPGTATAADLARTLGRPDSSVTREVARLVADGMLRVSTRGRRRLLSPDYTDPYMRALRDAFARMDLVEEEQDRAVQWWLTIPELAERLRPLIARDETDRALRLLLDTVNQIPLVADLHQLDPVLDAPPSTGDPRWDALVAGAVRYQLRQVGVPAPGWTRHEPLPSWWWPAGRGARAAFAVQSTPPELARLGIWIDGRNFSGA